MVIPMKINYAMKIIKRYGLLNIFLSILFIGLILHGGGKQLYNMIYSWKYQIPYEFRSYAGIGLSELIKNELTRIVLCQWSK